MKKNWFYLFLAMAIVAPLTSCNNDDDEIKPNDKQQHDPKSDEDQTAITSYDALEWLQGSLVVVDTDGKIIHRVYGKSLDESRPDVISLPVSTYDIAENIFLGWVAQGKENNLIKVEGGYDYNLTDDQDKAQGSVSLRAVEDEAGVVARMTVAEGTALKHISEVRFVDHDYWPENEAVAKYEAGKTYWFEGEELFWDHSQDNKEDTPLNTIKKDLEFYCVQGNGNGKEAILVWLSPEEDGFTGIDWLYKSKAPTPMNYTDYGAYKKLPSVAVAQKVLDFCNANPRAWYNMLEVMNGKGYFWKAGSCTGNAEFMLGSYDAEKNYIKCLDLDFVEDYVNDGYEGRKGKICDVYDRSWFHYRYIYIHIFPPYNE